MVSIDELHGNALFLSGGGISQAVVCTELLATLVKNGMDVTQLPFDLGGSSAGSIAIALLICGYESADVLPVFEEIYSMISFENIFDADFLVAYRDIAEELRECFPRLFQLTMLDAHIITGRDVVFRCSLMQSDGTLKPYAISWRTQPRMTLADAVYLSSSVPLLVESLSVDGVTAMDGDLTGGCLMDPSELQIGAACGGFAAIDHLDATGLIPPLFLKALRFFYSIHLSHTHMLDAAVTNFVPTGVHGSLFPPDDETVRSWRATGRNLATRIRFGDESGAPATQDAARD